MAAALLAAVSLGEIATSAPAASQTVNRVPLRQSVMGSVWGNTQLSFEERCAVLQRIGFMGLDLPRADQVPILRDYGLAPALMTGTGTRFQDGLIRRELHDMFEDAFTRE